MNTPSNALHESTLPSEGVAPAMMSATRPLYWSVRRELWENRFVYIAPFSIAAVFLFGFVISMVHLPAKMHRLAGLDAAQMRDAIVAPYDFAAGLMMLTSILVSVFYCVDALYGERRDRSILFWKSMPVSDLTTVLAKASIPLLLVPLLTFAITVAMQVIMALVSSAALLGSGMGVAELWTQLALPRMWVSLLYHFLTAHALWPMPIYCWLLLVSAWARRAVFLWAVLPLIAIAGLEGILFRSSYFAMLIGGRLIGSAARSGYSPPGTFPTHPLAHMTPERFLGSVGLWFGLAVSAAFLAAAVRLRRSQGPI